MIEVQKGSADTLNPGERRAHPRFPFTASVEVIEPHTKTRIEGRTSDLSCGGCYVDTMVSLPVDTAVEMCLTKENRSFKARAKVAYSVDGMGMGIKFIPAAPGQAQTLETWVGQLSGLLPCETQGYEADNKTKTHGGLPNKSFAVLIELIIELRRQGILSETKHKTFLQQLRPEYSEPAESNASQEKLRMTTTLE